MIAEIVITVPVGFALMILGFLLWKKQKIRLMHDYHMKHVKPQDVRAYTRLWGTALMVFGACVCPIGIIDVVFHTWMGWLLFAAGLAVCLILGNRAQKTYNGLWLG